MRPLRAYAASALCLTAVLSLPGRAMTTPKIDFSAVTEGERESFLLNADVTAKKPLGVGVTKSHRLTLSDGELTHHAHLQVVDTTKKKFKTGGRTYLNFRDSYKYNVAAYRLDRLLGLGLAPVSVEREMEGRRAAVSWWIDDVQMMEAERLEQGLNPPDPVRWSQQVRRIQLFNEWIANVDANATNILITDDWTVRLIDFTRAFRIEPLDRSTLPPRIETALLERLRALTFEEIEAVVGATLTTPEVRSLEERRRAIVAFYDEKIAEMGEAVLVAADEMVDSPRIAVEEEGRFAPGVTFARGLDDVLR